MDVILSSVLQVQPVTGAPLVLAAYRPNSGPVQPFLPSAVLRYLEMASRAITLGAISKPVKR